MPRSLRIEYEGARYHVMCRGNLGKTVFDSDAGREREIHDWEQRRDLAESAVQAIIKEGCKRLRINPSELGRLKKCAPEKMLLAIYIKENYSTGS